MTKLIFKNTLAESYHQRDRRDATGFRILIECGKTLYCHFNLETDTGGNSNIREFKDIWVCAYDVCVFLLLSKEGVGSQL